jgi:hypothetical protein
VVVVRDTSNVEIKHKAAKLVRLLSPVVTDEKLKKST